LSRSLGLDFIRGFILPEALEGGLAHHAITRPAGELDLGHKHGLDPMDVVPAARHAAALKGAALRFLRPDARKDSGNRALTEAGAHAANVDELAALESADKQRAKVTTSLQAPITTSWPARHLDFTQPPPRPDA
jgi:hypothetical protein